MGSARNFSSVGLTTLSAGAAAVAFAEARGEQQSRITMPASTSTR